MPQPTLSLLDLAAARTGAVLPSRNVLITDDTTYQKLISKQILRIAVKLPDLFLPAPHDRLELQDEFRLQDDGSLHLYLSDAQSPTEMVHIPKGTWRLRTDIEAIQHEADSCQDTDHRQSLLQAYVEAKFKLAERNKKHSSVQWEHSLFIVGRDQDSLNHLAFIASVYQTSPRVTEVLNEWLAGSSPRAAIHTGDHTFILHPLPHFEAFQAASLVTQLVKVLQDNDVVISDTALTTLFDDHDTGCIPLVHRYWTHLGGKSLDYPIPATQLPTD